MDSALLEALLNEDESSSLDFKRDQYPFEGASEDDKSELLKDLLAFANSWRREEAYILVGVEEIRGSRSRPVGVAAHLDDAKLQQFVNSKVQKPLQFAYEVQRIDGTEIGVIRVPVQDRPFFLKKDFGRVKKDTVYLRHGSSTNTADPDEIARMAVATRKESPPQLSVQARVWPMQQGVFIVSISNAAGSGVARAPYLELEPRGPFMLSQHGLDGTTRQHGLPLLPQGEASRRYKFAGTTDVVVHPGTNREIARIEWRGAVDKVPTEAQVEYVVGADGVAVVQGVLSVGFH